MFSRFAKFNAFLLTASLLSGFSVDSNSNEASEESQSGSVKTEKTWYSKKIKPRTVEIDLRSLPEVTPWKAGMPIKEIPRPISDPSYTPPPKPINPVTSELDPLLNKQYKALIKSSDLTSVDLGFDGEGFSGVNPPDPSGDVGKKYYIHAINGRSGSIMNIYDKATGNKVAGPSQMDALGESYCASGLGDPIILYDELASRWLLSEFSSSGNQLCVYISKTEDPVTGGWHVYSFAAPSFPDYPKYGVWGDAYYVGTNERTSAFYALERDAMLAGQPARMIRKAIPDLRGFGFNMLMPVDHDGELAPVAGTPGYFMRHRDDEAHNPGSNDSSKDFIELWGFKADFDSPDQSTLTKVIDIEVEEFSSEICGLSGLQCFSQLGSSTRLDPLRQIIMNRIQYRNFGSYEVILGNYVVDVDGSEHGGIRWFELRREGSQDWKLHQEGTYSPDQSNRWQGGIAMDKDGNIALAYAWVEATSYPGLRYTGRLANDPAGVMTQQEKILINGTSAIPSARFGDYSQLVLDPDDGCTFWYTNEYGKSSGRWGTYISSFKFDSCQPGSGGGNGGGSGGQSEVALTNGIETSGQSAMEDDGNIYFIDVPAGAQNLTFETDGGTGDVDLYVRFKDKPTTTDFDCNSPLKGNKEVCSISNIQAGRYYALLHAYKDFSGVKLIASYDEPGTNVELPLQNGVELTNLTGDLNAKSYFYIDVPAGAANLKFELNGGSGDAHLYVRFGDKPTQTNYDCRSEEAGNSERCSVANVQGGRYYIMLLARPQFDGARLMVAYDQPGTGGSSGGSTGGSSGGSTGGSSGGSTGGSSGGTGSSSGGAGGSGGGTGGNSAPIATVSPDTQVVVEGSQVELDASQSNDPDNDQLTFKWEQVSGPMADLTDLTSDRLSFVAPDVDAESELVFKLSLDDGNGGTASIEAKVTVTNQEERRSSGGPVTPIAFALLLIALLRRRY